MMPASRHRNDEHPPAPRPGPGRPKDLAKRAAILAAAERLFVEHGFDRVSMDQVASEAAVSKLTVYSHFGDKETLFAAAVRRHCEGGMPLALFDPAPGVTLRERLRVIGRAYLDMVMAPAALSGHRMLCSPQSAGTGLPALAWKAGYQPARQALAALLERCVAAGELSVDSPERAAGHFFVLLKGEPHMRAVLGMDAQPDMDDHVADVVDLFLRAYGPRD